MNGQELALELTKIAVPLAEKILHEEVKYMERNGVRINSASWISKVNTSIEDARSITLALYNDFSERFEKIA